MSLYLAYSYSIGLSENESDLVDQLVSKNLKAIYIFITKFPSNSKRKAKNFYIYFI